jgi:fucose permease
MIFEVERILIHSLGWPQWALRTLALLSFVVILLTIVQYLLIRNENQENENPQQKKNSSENSLKLKEKKNLTKFRLFQIQYLSVYFIVMLADWLQGTNMYTLYASYGVNIGYLFLTGFLSSAIFGTFLGIYVDTWGRRFGCILFCVLEVGALLSPLSSHSHRSLLISWSISLQCRSCWSGEC